MGERLSELARGDPQRRIMCVGDQWVTLEDLDRRSGQLGAGLAALGVGFGDRVALVLPNSMAAIEAIFACAKLGAIVVPLNAYLKGDFLQYQLSRFVPVSGHLRLRGREGHRTTPNRSPWAKGGDRSGHSRLSPPDVGTDLRYEDLFSAASVAADSNVQLR